MKTLRGGGNVRLSSSSLSQASSSSPNSLFDEEEGGEFEGFCKADDANFGDYECKGQLDDDDDDALVGASEEVINLDEVVAKANALAVDDGTKGLVFKDSRTDAPIWNLEHLIRAEPDEPNADKPYDVDEALVANVFPPSPPKPSAAAELPASIRQALDVASAYDSINEVSVAELLAVDSPVVLDIREGDNEDDVPGSVRIPFSALSDQVKEGELDHLRDARVHVICQTGRTSMQACVRLSKVYGWSDVVNVVGGVDEYMRVTSQ